MPIMLISFKKDPSGGVMFHGFLAPNESAAQKKEEAHAGICPSFGPALDKGETIEEVIEVDTIPEFDPESIEDWLDDLLDLEVDEEEEEE